MLTAKQPVRDIVNPMYHLLRIEEKLNFAHRVYLWLDILTVYRLFP